MVSNKPLIAVAKGQTPTRLPIWFLRQAGRYLPEYRELRRKVEFLNLCETPKLAAQATLQPLKRYDLDAAIIFSDILLVPKSLGQQLTFEKDHGPVLSPAIRTGIDLKNLTTSGNKIDDLLAVGDAISLVGPCLDSSQTLIGFAGAPYTVASYMIEGSSSKDYQHVKRMIFQEEAAFHSLMTLLVETTVSYLKMQVDAGAQALMLFDSWAGHLGSKLYRTHVYSHMKRLIDELQKFAVPIIFFPGQGGTIVSCTSNLGYDILAADWRLDLHDVPKLRQSQKPAKALQGNLNPAVLSWGTRETVYEHTRSILKDIDDIGYTGKHIFNVGHGLLPTTSPEAINWCISQVRAWPDDR